MDNKYKYTYEKTADYCYKDTDVLINKLNITNDEDLFNAERELVSLRTYELNEKTLKGNFDLILKFFFYTINLKKLAYLLKKCIMLLTSGKILINK